MAWGIFLRMLLTDGYIAVVCFPVQNVDLHQVLLLGKVYHVEPETIGSIHHH